MGVTRKKESKICRHLVRIAVVLPTTLTSFPEYPPAMPTPREEEEEEEETVAEKKMGVVELETCLLVMLALSVLLLLLL